MDNYAVSLVHRAPAQLTAPTFTELGPIPAIGLRWADEHNREGDAAVAFNPSTLESAVVDSLVDALDDDTTVPGLELWVYRGSSRVFRGPIIGVTISGIGDEWALVAAGPLYYLRYMYVLADTTYAGTDQHTIGKALIDQWQAENYGHFGLDTSSIGASGTTRDRSYEQGDDVFTRLVQLMEVNNGFDAWIDPDTYEVNFGTKGSDKSATVVLDRRGITDAGLAFSLAAGDIASEGLALNTDDPPTTATVANSSLESSFGKTGIVASFYDVVQQSTLTDHATALQAARSKPLVVPSPKLFPVAGADVTDFESGDTVQFVPEVGVPNLTYTRRIQRRQITVTEDGNEDIGVTFA